MRDLIISKFKDMKEHRAEAIARSETVYASTQADIQAWKSSGVVE
jgi:hypothetical protein